MSADSDSSRRRFTGQARHALDPKNRVTIPARWRRGETDEFAIVPHKSNHYLIGMLPGTEREISAQVKALDWSALKKQNFLRDFNARLLHISTDKQGRLLLTEEHCRALDLQGEVMLVGTDERFEVWHPERWADFQKENAAVYDEGSDLLGL